MKTIKFLCLLLLSSNPCLTLADEYELLWKHPKSSGNNLVLALIINESVDYINREPVIRHVTKKDTFTGEEEYRYTQVSCKANIAVLNQIGLDVALDKDKSSSGGVMMDFVFGDGDVKKMVGNMAFMKSFWSVLNNPPILKSGDMDFLEMVEENGKIFQSKKEAENYLQEGNCRKFDTVENVRLQGILGGILLRDGTKLPLEYAIEFGKLNQKK